MSMDKNTDQIKVTPAARAHLQKEIEKWEGKGIGIRLSLKKYGCSGYGYETKIIEKYDQTDKQFFMDTFVVVIDEKDYDFLRGTTIDFVKEGLRTGFKFMNPNAKTACGCGDSVGF